MFQRPRPRSDEEEGAARARVVAIARSWIGTPYHHAGRLKGVGVDCATLVAEVFHEAGLIPRLDLPYYSGQWHLHRGDERYLTDVLRFAAEISGPPRPADLVLWRFGRCYSHGAIVVEWPLVIHAYTGRSTVLEDAEAAAWLKYCGKEERPRKYLSYWG